MNRAQRRKAGTTVQRDNYVIGFCHPTEVDAHFARSLARLALSDAGRIANILACGSGPRIATARNDIVRAFLKMDPGPEWLLMLDADMVFPPDILARFEQVIDPQLHPIVGGLAFIYEHFGALIRPNMTVWGHDENNKPVLHTVTGFPDNALCKVAATGAACLMIHRGALEKMAQRYGTLIHPWFQETTTDEYEWGEDITFCVRAGQCGIPIHVHTGIEFGHMKKSPVGSADFEPFRQALPNEESDNAA